MSATPVRGANMPFVVMLPVIVIEGWMLLVLWS